MGLLASVHRRHAGTPDPVDPFWYAPAEWHHAFNDTGIRVTPELAMSVSAIWAGVTFMGRNIGSLPCHLHERFETGPDREGKRRAKNEPLWRTLRWRPNQIQTAQEYWEMQIGHVLLRGNAYSRIVEGRRGFAEHLLPLHPDRVRPERLPTGRVRYLVYHGAQVEKLTQDEVFHVRGFSSDGVSGLSLTAVAARSIGAAIAADTYAARFFKHGATAALAVTAPADLGDEEEADLHASISRYLSGLENVGGVLIVPSGATIDKLGINPQEAQLLPTREHVVREVARWLGLPTLVLADAGKEPTHASSEVFAIHLVTQSFRPMAVRVEQAIQRDLILERDQDRLFAEFLLDALVRGDLKARAQSHQLASLAGWMTRNEARDKENMNPGPPELDEFWQPMNMGLAGDDTDDARVAQPQRERGQVEARFGVRATLMALEVAGRLVRKEISAVQKAAKKFATDGAAWSAWLRDFYGDDYARHVSATLKIPMAVAREYAARQGLALERSAGGVGILEEWEHTVTPDLAALALGDHAVVALLKGDEDHALRTTHS